MGARHVRRQTVACTLRYSMRRLETIKFRKIDILFSAICALVSLVSHAAAGQTVNKVRLAYAGWELGTAVAYVGVDSGLFKKNQLEIEEIPIRDTLSAGVQSLIGVDVLIGFGNTLAVLHPVAGGADVKLIGFDLRFDECV